MRVSGQPIIRLKRYGLPMCDQFTVPLRLNLSMLDAKPGDFDKCELVLFLDTIKDAIDEIREGR